ncbi:MAG: alpha/beta hydrolase [Proteobacteria bacterium]|jgi:pimeloyl-ACP methyl ester carboxylesterase|nr:alpha/beta hydrolase [Pseudomonadota bacterium]
MQQHTIQCQSPAGSHAMMVREWGVGQTGPVVVCVHGLTRNSSDFQALAQALSADGMRVLAPDIVGRGNSDWLNDPQYYRIDQYCQDILAMVRQLQLGPVFWVGTSMGGLIAMSILGAFFKDLAEHGCSIQRLVLNDVGAEIPHRALSRIADYVGESIEASSCEEASMAMRVRMVSFGAHTDEQWRLLTEPAVRQRPDGKWTVNYDLKIAEPFKALFTSVAGDVAGAANAQAAPMTLWPLYEAIACPTLLLRGEHSDLLPAEVAIAMTQRGPKARLVEIPGAGHAPSLVTPEQIQVVHQFLRKTA